jgi:hypothetical protein
MLVVASTASTVLVETADDMLLLLRDCIVPSHFHRVVQAAVSEFLFNGLECLGEVFYTTISVGTIGIFPSSVVIIAVVLILISVRGGVALTVVIVTLFVTLLFTVSARIGLRNTLSGYRFSLCCT